jgi:small subunit ribosomal protein S2
VLTTTSLRCIQVIAGVLGRAGEAGQKQRLAAAAKGDITYLPAHGLHMPETEEEGESVSIRGTSSKGASTAAKAAFDDLKNLDDVVAKLDELNNQEDHRLKGGRELKASS